jgi:tripeptide aminopeptidase
MTMFDDRYKFTCVERFLRYVKYDTRSDDDATSFPSTEKQKILLKDLAAELYHVGLKDARMNEWGYVIGTLPGNSDKKVPTIAFIGHADTSPQVSGENVKPTIRTHYAGGDIQLENGLVIKESENPALKNMLGLDIITTDGTTLLGADDKAGVAEIVDAMHYLSAHPEIKHGDIKVCITPDEETGRGTEKLDVKDVNANYAYTVDGSSRGEVETETFSADAVTIKFHGKNIHPGYAKDKMINSVKPAAAFLDSLPKGTLSPETTEDREGYVHCVSINGNEELTTLKFIIRDFKAEKLEEYEELLKKLAADAISMYPGSTLDFEVTHQYQNMKVVLDQYPQVTEYAVEAMKRLGIKTKEHYIRGGTDGARLCFMGLPTPNIFAGSQSYHSPLEWIAIQDMEMAVKTIVEIAAIWEEKS